ncbi:MAG: hypothetical protein ABS76_09800 [Pelagibacterium sp. SCN 64-44]|nr:MAG: hypothetical protein ABS76_09800 [Pelagibacterium sp. SCN 64-44]
MASMAVLDGAFRLYRDFDFDWAGGGELQYQIEVLPFLQRPGQSVQLQRQSARIEAEHARWYVDRSDPLMSGAVGADGQPDNVGLAGAIGPGADEAVRRAFNMQFEKHQTVAALRSGPCPGMNDFNPPRLEHMVFMGVVIFCPASGNERRGQQERQDEQAEHEGLQRVEAPH